MRTPTSEPASAAPATSSATSATSVSSVPSAPVPAGARWQLRALALVAALAATAVGAEPSAGKPALLARIDAAVLDDPIAAWHGAEARLREPATEADAPRRLEAALLLAVAGTQLERNDIAEPALATGRALAQQLRDAAAGCALDAVELSVLTTNDRSDEARRFVAERLAASVRQGTDWCSARLHGARAKFNTWLGRTAEAMEDLDETRRLARRIDDRAAIAVALSDFSWLYKAQQDDPGRLQRAIGAAEDALALVEPRTERYLAATVHHNLAGILREAGRLADARSHAGRALEYASAIRDDIGTGYIVRLQGQIELSAGKPAEALRHFERAKQMFAPHGPLDMWLECGIRRADALRALGRLAEAEQELDAIEPTRRQVDVAATDILFHTVLLAVTEAMRNPARALQASKALAAAERRSAADANRKQASEIAARFRVQAAEEENRHLRLQQRADATQRWLLLATLALSVLLTAGLLLHVLQQRRMRQRLSQLASHDDLTGLANRRSIVATARGLQAQRRTDGSPGCIALLDIDHFKQINDNYGHPVGDAALTTFASTCAAQLRAEDRIGRFGGEEFLLVLPNMHATDAGAAFERLRAAVAAMPVPGMPEDRRLSFSMGCAELAPGEPVDHALQRADAALYAAKRAGRDRLVLADKSRGENAPSPPPV